MADLIYKTTPWGDVTVKESWPQWLKDHWLEALKGYTPLPAPFIPKFREATGSDGINTWKLDSHYFASPETAQYIADKFGDGTVLETPFGGTGGVFTASDQELTIRLKNGKLVNAGLVAAYYERNPEDRFPGLAERMIKDVLSRA